MMSMPAAIIFALWIKAVLPTFVSDEEKSLEMMVFSKRVYVAHEHNGQYRFKNFISAIEISF